MSDRTYRGSFFSKISYRQQLSGQQSASCVGVSYLQNALQYCFPALQYYYPGRSMSQVCRFTGVEGLYYNQSTEVSVPGIFHVQNVLLITCSTVLLHPIIFNYTGYWLIPSVLTYSELQGKFTCFSRSGQYHIQSKTDKKVQYFELGEYSVRKGQKLNSICRT